MREIHLDRNMIPAHLRRNYTGRQFAAIVTETTTIPALAGLWSGGTRDSYVIVRLADGAELPAPVHQGLHPDDKARRDTPIKLEPGIAVVRHTIFCGKDHGLTFYVHPADAAQLLPAPSAELTPHESIVLKATTTYKASYGGLSRYQLAKRDATGYANHVKVPDGATFPTPQEWETAKASLIAKGLLNKAGAITTAGRNAVQR